MAKKDGKGGFWDNFMNKPFGGMFDFNRDGREDLLEQSIAYKVFEEFTKEQDTDSHDYYAPVSSGGGFSGRSSDWRLTCEDGSEYDIDPEEYETEEEYEEALEEAKYGWRETAEDGSEYDIDPEEYETEEEYEEALEEAKYGWRETAEDGSEYDIDPEEYETEEEYEEALEEAKYERRETAEDDSEEDEDPEEYETGKECETGEECEIEEECETEDEFEYDLAPEEYEKILEAMERGLDEMIARREEKLQKRREDELWADQTIYTYYGVKLPFSDRPYSYRADGNSLKIGDKVIVPVGEENEEMEGMIVSAGQCLRIGVPFPVEKTKFIIRKVETE